MNGLATQWVLVFALMPGGSVALPGHVDARDYPATGQGSAAFAQMARALERGFDDICGDTFCEGEYANLRALQLRCAVRRLDGGVVRCLWSFAGSWASVDGATGAVRVEARTFACRLPVVEGTALTRLLAVLRGPEALHQALPGTRLTAYDGLIDCL